MREKLLPENWIPLLVGVEPKDNQAKDKRKEGFIPCGKNAGNLSQSSVALSSSIGEVLNSRYIHIHEGA